MIFSVSHLCPCSPSAIETDCVAGATTDVAIWSTVEEGLAITAGSLATLRPLFRVLANKFNDYYGAVSAKRSKNMPSAMQLGHTGQDSKAPAQLDLVPNKNRSLWTSQVDPCDTRNESEEDLNKANLGSQDIFVRRSFHITEDRDGQRFDSV